MQIEYKKIDEIIPYENNPRKNDPAVAAVAESIKQFGFKVPVIIDQNNTIICGHTRHKAAKKLHIKEIPCIYADDLTPDQIKAFRIADNKVSEIAEWDIEKLDIEIGDIDIDMSIFGFEIEEIEEKEEKEEKYYGAERERTFDYYNMYDIDIDRVTEKWEMPIIKACKHIPQDLISFNYAKSSSEFEKGIHFYIDDYQFERIWNAPHDYMDILGKYDCVLTPDFSLYTDMPLPMQIWNVYRSKMIGQIMQDYGIKVIPTLQWCRENSFDFAFDGIEAGGTVSVSTIGVKQSKEAENIWFAGMDEAIKRLKPTAIIIYGGDIGYDFGNIKTKYISNHNAERFKNDNI